MAEAIPDFGEPKLKEERYVLKKFDGDWTDEQIENGEAGEPVETRTLVYRDGVLVEDTINNGEDVLREGGNS